MKYIKKMALIRAYKPYWDWEDFRSGMYDDMGLRCDAIDRSRALLSSVEFYDVARLMLDCWPIASLVNLTNSQINRRAWLGRAAACFHCGATEREVRQAWPLLSATEMQKANKIADELIQDYEKRHPELHRVVGGEMLF